MRRRSLALLIATGCTGTLLPAPWKAPAPTDAPVVPVVQRGAVPSPLKRLTHDQYDATVAQVFGTTTRASRDIPADGAAGPFVSNAEATITELHVDQYVSAAQAVAQEAAPRLRSQLICSAEGEACAQQQLALVASLAFRRPVLPGELERLMAVYRVGLEGSDATAAFALALQALLLSPDFLFHVELGVPEGDQVQLTPWELAARLSYFLVGGPPDEALRAAAATGTLPPALVAEHAARLLRDGAGKAQLGRFHAQWLGLSGLPSLDKDVKRYPLFLDPAPVREALAAELDDYVDFVVRQSDARLSTLLTAPVAFPRAATRAIYGLEDFSGTAQGAPVGTLPSQRAGLLTLPAVQATLAGLQLTSPVHRGLMVYRNVLCLQMGNPPPGVDTALPPPGAGQTRREVFAQHESSPICGSCHRAFDPFGFVFEHYDAVGAWRTQDFDDRIPVDARVTLQTGLSELDGPIADAIELGQRLAQSSTVERCVARQWYRFAFGRLDTAADAATLAEVQRSFHASRGDLRALLLTLAQSDAFRTRTP